ncbi:MAG TPA: protein-glutamate O-methyltransferase CheR [Bacteroidales bacterium]|nr:protein-glutamate O-methyltransferase CheR [Bacteroidales bacterium]
MMNIELSEEEKSRIQDIEINLFLEAVNERYGYDFRKYSMAYIKRRLLASLRKNNARSISELQYKILYDIDFFRSMLIDISLNVTEMFRDPKFFVAVRETVLPILRTYPFIKIWHAGCSTGEEVYSMAILLSEEGLLERTIIYATDFNTQVVKKASEAIYPVENIKQYSANYYKAKGKGEFSDYFTVKYGSAIIDQKLKKSIVFSDHNLVSDGVFGEMNLIVCRNVLIYFNRELQNRVLTLFTDSLIPGGVLCLGTKETLLFYPDKLKYNQLSKMNIFRKAYETAVR